MELLGMLDSPYVRRVAITAQFLGIKIDHRPISIFRDYEELRAINPMAKVPTLICDDGTLLVESTLIIDYLESLSESGVQLMPADNDQFLTALERIGVALVAMEKTVQLFYERSQRPEEKRHEPWKARLEQQLEGALVLMEQTVTGKSNWIFGDSISQADISIAVSWRFIANMLKNRFDLDGYTGLATFSAKAEELAEFKACGF